MSQGRRVKGNLKENAVFFFFFFLGFFLLSLFLFFDKVSSSGWPQMHSVAEADLELQVWSFISVGINQVCAVLGIEPKVLYMLLKHIITPAPNVILSRCL